MTDQENPFGFDPEDDIVRQERTQWLDPIVIVSGGFDPVHKGHMALFNAAAKHGKVHVLLNSDDWLTRKKGAPLLSFQTREEVLRNMASVHVIHSVDDRDETVLSGLLELRKKYPNTKIFFANGGDRRIDSVPEMWLCKDLEIHLLWNVGGDKIDSSSKLLNQYMDSAHSTKNITHRNWGDYEIIGSGEGWLAKILTIEPGKSISLQKHTHRSEEWLILKGYGCYTGNEQDCYTIRVYPGLKISIPKLTWHWVKNTEKIMSLQILEAWFGEKLEESDIERKEDEGEIIILE
jgi:cytidyltransferase-like protein